jgi:hypothetical protein
MKYVIPILIFLLVVSCKNQDDDTGSLNCTEIFVFGLTVQVRDINTGGIILDNISVTATDGSYSEELAFSFDNFFGAGERPGNYTLTVEADGYLTLVTPVIQVDADECHVITELVEIQLKPL